MADSQDRKRRSLFEPRARALFEVRRASTGVELPGDEVSPLRKIARRLVWALAMIVFVALLTYLERDGFTDPEDGTVGLLDSFYYSTVSVTTTGYGDIRPVTDSARLVTTLLVTPARVLFLIVLVGTTLEILAEHTRAAYRVARWRKSLQGHTIICGYGTKGRTAIATLLAHGSHPEEIVVIDPRPEARTQANAAGLATIDGDASTQAVLEEAGVRDAKSVVVAVNRDDAAVLITLTAREVAPQATIVASVREEENVHLLHQSGADSVVTSSGAAGRLLGMATHSPGIAEVLEDLLVVGQGLDIVQHEVGDAEAGPVSALSGVGPVIAVLRDEMVLSYDDPRAQEVAAGDRVVALRSHSG